MRFSLIIVLVALLSLFGCSSSDDKDNPSPGSQIPDILNNAVTEAHPGFVLYVDSPEHGKWELAAGKADIESQENMETDSRLRMGSTTKTFTAALCLLLHEDGLLDFDKKLSEFLPDITVPHDSLITIENLLNMTSGILDYANDGDKIMNEILDNPSRIFTPQELIEYAIEITDPNEINPGTVWHYSNTNYVLLGLIIEEVSGLTYADLLKSRILVPFELNEILIDEEPAKFAHGYLDLDDDGILDDVTSWNHTPFWSAGCLVGTAEDLGKFASALFNGQILADESLALMKSWYPLGDGIPFEYGYGCGFHTDMNLIGHNGGTPGYAAEMWYHTDTGTIITVISNSNRTDGDHTFNIVHAVGQELNFSNASNERSSGRWITL